jgi:cytochrome P450
MVGEAIAARRREIAKNGKGPADDLLDHMLGAEDPETGRRMSSSDLINNMQFFIVAGHETTALAISWALYLLANSPEDQARARAEARTQLKGRVAEALDLPAMPFINQVLEESMRLYPPVGLVARHVVARDELCGRVMNPNDILFLPIWALHRHEMWWEKPGLFDPGRFKPGIIRDRYQYLPFGAGPRVCVGANFAMMQANIILSTLIQNFRFSQSQPLPEPVMTMTVRPQPGIFLEVERLH